MHGWCYESADRNTSVCLYDKVDFTIKPNVTNSMVTIPGSGQLFELQVDVMIEMYIGWWVDATLRSLFSSRTFLQFEKFTWGPRIRVLYWIDHSALCLNFGLFTYPIIF